MNDRTDFERVYRLLFAKHAKLLCDLGEALEAVEDHSPHHLTAPDMVGSIRQIYNEYTITTDQK